jgi:hypothetical protein
MKFNILTRNTVVEGSLCPAANYSSSLTAAAAAKESRNVTNDVIIFSRKQFNEVADEMGMV